MKTTSKDFDRRTFLKASGVTALGLLTTHLGCSPKPKTTDPSRGFGPLSAHSGNQLSLPKDFHYVIVQRSGDKMSDGYKMPAQPDGMACFEDVQGRLILLRNHELGDADFVAKWGSDLMSYPGGTVPQPRYRDGVYGGVTRVVIDPKALAKDFSARPGQASTAIVRSNLVLAGTDKNCAGGVVQGGWVTCEESSAEGHGYAFMTRPGDDALMAPRRLDSWGRFQREAVAHEPQSGIVYMTEDHADACFYRFVPEDPLAPMGKGRLEAMVLEGVPHTHPYTHAQGSAPVPPHWEHKQTWPVRWIPVPDPSATKDPCRVQAAALGATKFCRTEGVTVDGSDVWFVASTGGRSHGGQIFRYVPKSAKTGGLILEHEVGDRRTLSSPDNLVMTPWGDVLMAEDNYETGGVVTHQYLRVMTQAGEIHDLVRNNRTESMKKAPGAEFTGCCFSPDGRILFVNLQTPEHVTVAITGPWPSA